MGVVIVSILCLKRDRVLYTCGYHFTTIGVSILNGVYGETALISFSEFQEVHTF